MSMFMVRNLLDRLIRDLIYCAIADLIGEIQLNAVFYLAIWLFMWLADQLNWAAIARGLEIDFRGTC